MKAEWMRLDEKMVESPHDRSCLAVSGLLTPAVCNAGHSPDVLEDEEGMLSPSIRVPHLIRRHR